jgi:hypothetical protein
MSSLGWDLLVSHLVATSTATEDTHALLESFLSKDSYYRFNPLLATSTAIDEKDKEALMKLKSLAKEYCNEI